MAFGSFPVIGSLVGGVFSGAGNVKANYQNKGTANELNWKIAQLRGMADPVGGALVGAAAPGGLFRRARLGQLNADTERQLGQRSEALGGSAWRWGGPGAGLPQRQWQDALAGSAMSGNDITADTENMDLLGRLSALQRGYGRAFAPATIYENPYLGYGQGISSAATAYGQAQQGNRI